MGFLGFHRIDMSLWLSQTFAEVFWETIARSGSWA